MVSFRHRDDVCRHLVTRASPWFWSTSAHLSGLVGLGLAGADGVADAVTVRNGRLAQIACGLRFGDVGGGAGLVAGRGGGATGHGLRMTSVDVLLVHRISPLVGYLAKVPSMHMLACIERLSNVRARRHDSLKNAYPGKT